MSDLFTGVFLAERSDSKMDDDNRMQGVLKVPKHNLLLLGSGPTTNCTNLHRSSLQRSSVSESEAGGVFLAEWINTKKADADRMQGVLKVLNHNSLLLGSGSTTNCANLHRSSLRRRSVSESEAD